MVQGSPEVHIKCKVHELLTDLRDRQDVERYAHRHRRTTVHRSHPSVVANLSGGTKITHCLVNFASNSYPEASEKSTDIHRRNLCVVETVLRSWRKYQTGKHSPADHCGRFSMFFLPFNLIIWKWIIFEWMTFSISMKDILHFDQRKPSYYD